MLTTACYNPLLINLDTVVQWLHTRTHEVRTAIKTFLLPIKVQMIFHTEKKLNECKNQCGEHQKII